MGVILNSCNETEVAMRSGWSLSKFDWEIGDVASE